MTRSLIAALLALLLFKSTSSAFTTLLGWDQQPKKEWIKLFDGKSLEGWHHFNNRSEIKNWKIEDGALVCLGAKGPSGSGDIITDQVFEDFELRWEWKVDQGSNSGVFYHIVEDPKYKRAIETSPEYQIIDDISYPAKLAPSQLTGSNYDMHVAGSNKKLKPVGEWNTSKIVFKNGKVEHWLNGNRIVKFKAWSEDWKNRKAASKWKDFPDYGMSGKGNIGLQDHGNKAYFKNIEIREL
ncbi:3-keto-disaccharide hydrolase [Daejeonella lutea]|uniref:3-keto-alpha-glucoside-1,2-lyase/3-keto-2-hydroxy-glucal hydratase domain-containing protein n=1 Tax=Daejeonella lutea TaxID=572036 RepID=A0A1T5A6T4_9SPHI|nr:DUF1080 domain-containing protein [Daejeonella lutea]SKB30704.1 protein of unknown function [Daejeonella lutea]